MNSLAMTDYERAQLEEQKKDRELRKLSLAVELLNYTSTLGNHPRTVCEARDIACAFVAKSFAE